MLYSVYVVILNCLLLLCVYDCMLVIQNDIQSMEKLSYMSISLHEKSHKQIIKNGQSTATEAEPLSWLEYARSKGRAGQEEGSDGCRTAEVGRW